MVPRPLGSSRSWLNPTGLPNTSVGVPNCNSRLPANMRPLIPLSSPPFPLVPLLLFPGAGKKLAPNSPAAAWVSIQASSRRARVRRVDSPSWGLLQLGPRVAACSNTYRLVGRSVSW